MHEEMAGIYEARVDFNKTHYRLFCVLDRNEKKSKRLEENTLVIIDGESKPYRTTIPRKRYAVIRALADEYLAREPRSICENDEEDDDDDENEDGG